MIASRSASSTSTNSPFATSQPLTISSRSTSRSCTSHQRFCLIGVMHSRCSCRKETSDWRAAGFVASASPTGMLTRPKLIEPFQIVRMGRTNCTWTRLLLPHLLACVRTIWSLWQGARRARSGSARPISSRRRRLARGLLGRSGGAVDELANGLLALGIGKGDAFGILAHTRLEWALLDFALAQIGAVPAPIYPSSSAAECLLHPRALERRRLPRRGRGAPGEDRGRAARARLHDRDARRTARARPRARRREPDALDRAPRPDRRGRPLHLHLHVGHDRPAEGLHDPEPQLLRNDGEDPTRSRSSSSRPT